MRKPAKWAAAAILTGAVLRLLFLGAKSLWFDEASTLLLAWAPLSRLPAQLTSNEVNPPVYYALMHFWLKAFSDPRRGLRLFSALCGIASLFAFRAVAARALPESARKTALWLAAASSFWIHIAQDGRSYSLLLLISLLSTLAALELADRPRARIFAAYAGLAALGLYTHYYYAILLAGHALWLARVVKDRRGLLLAHAAVALAFAPWLRVLAAQMRTHSGEAVLGEALSFPRVLDLLGTTFFDVTFLGLALPAWTGIAVGAGLLALAIRARTEDRRAFGFCATHVAAAVALVAAVELWSGRPVTQARYFTPLSPVLILFAALGAGRGRLRLAAGIVAAAGVAGYFFSALTVDPRLDLLAAAIRRSSDASVPIVHIGTYYYLPLRVYYLPERRNLIISKAAVGMDYAGMAPYPGVIKESDLPALGPCVVVDESRTLTPDRVRLGTGAQLAAMLAR
jgi:mannosyltransferase